MMTLKTNIIENAFGSVDFDVYEEIISVDEEGNEITKEYVKIDNLFVNSEFRGQGKAKELLRKAIEVIKSETGVNASDILIVAEPKEDSVDLERLITFYSDMGLSVVAY